jgi:large subunit ribosomal protein L7/L12
MSKNIEQLVEDLSSLTVMEMASLKDMLENKWGVKAAAAAPAFAQAAPSGQATQAAAAQESTDFQVTMTEAALDKKIGIIKVLRELTGLGLKEAKDMVESAPKVVKETAPKAEAEEMKKKLEAAGAKVTLKGL